MTRIDALTVEPRETLYQDRARAAIKRNTAARLIRFDGEVVPLDSAIAASGLTRTAFLRRFGEGCRTMEAMIRPRRGSDAARALTEAPVRPEGHSDDTP